jgi:hypothetical protein
VIGIGVCVCRGVCVGRPKVIPLMDKVSKGIWGGVWVGGGGSGGGRERVTRHSHQTHAYTHIYTHPHKVIPLMDKVCWYVCMCVGCVCVCG